MSIVITAGCPDSGWDMVTPILQQSGLELADASVNLWLDECFQAAGLGHSAQICQPLQPESRLGVEVVALFSKYGSSPVLVADGRNTWLLDFWAKQFPDAKFLLFFTRAETALAHALHQGGEPQRFIEQWQAINRQILSFLRRHRHCALLLDAEAVRLHPQALEAASRRVGLALESTANVSGPAIQPSAIERLLADHLLETQPAVQTLQMELEASSQPLGDILPKTPLQPVELIDSYRQGQAHRRALQLQLHKMQEELEAATRLNQQNEQARKHQSAVQQELKIQLDEAHRTLKNQEFAYREAVQDNELLLLQLRQAQEELEAITLNQQNEDARKQQSAAAQQELNIQVDETRRALKKLETRHREAAQENELLLLQLKQVQKEQGHFFLKWQELDEERRRGLQIENGEIDKLPENGKAAITSRLSKAIRAIPGMLNNKHKAARKKIQKQVNLLKGSGFFDKAWYLSTYKDVAGSGIDPVKHYLIHGAAEGRNPSPAFNTRAYLAANPDIVAAGMNPLVHFVKFGRSEGRSPQTKGAVAVSR